MRARRVRITDTTLRDGHQSLWATRMRTHDMLPILETMDEVGFHSLECWGGATFDADSVLNEVVRRTDVSVAELEEVATKSVSAARVATIPPRR